MQRNATKSTAVILVTRFSLAATMLLATFGAIFAQDTTEKESPSAWMHPDRIQSLEDIKKLNEFGPYGEEVDMGFDIGDSIPLGPVQHDPPLIQQIAEMRQQRRMKIEKIKRKLRDPQTDRASQVDQLKSALKDYFVVDMRYRVMELEEIKAKLAETEAKLLRRLKAKDEAVDLQLQIMVREADGFGFFGEETTPPLGRPGPGVFESF